MSLSYLHPVSSFRMTTRKAISSVSCRVWSGRWRQQNFGILTGCSRCDSNLAIDHVYYQKYITQMILKNAKKANPLAFALFGKKKTYPVALKCGACIWIGCVNSSVQWIRADHFVALGKPCLIHERLWGRRRSQKPSKIPCQHRRPPSTTWALVSFSRQTRCISGSWTASHLQRSGARRHLQSAAVKDLSGQTPPSGAVGYSKDMGSHLRACDRVDRRYPATRSVEFGSIWTDTDQAARKNRKESQQSVVRETALVSENLPFHEGLSRVRSSIDPDRSQIAWTTKQWNRRKRGPPLAKRRRGEKAKERPSHKDRTALSQLAGIANDVARHHQEC